MGRHANTRHNEAVGVTTHKRSEARDSGLTDGSIATCTFSSC